MRRLLADEHIPKASVVALRSAGFDVCAIAEDCPGIADRDVLRLARDQRRWLVTFDRDYGDLIFRRGEPPPPGVVYLRMLPSDPQYPARVVQDVLDRFEGEGVFLVVGRNTNVRERALPGHGRS